MTTKKSFRIVILSSLLTWSFAAQAITVRPPTLGECLIKLSREWPGTNTPTFSEAQHQIANLKELAGNYIVVEKFGKHDVMTVGNDCPQELTIEVDGDGAGQTVTLKNLMNRDATPKVKIKNINAPEYTPDYNVEMMGPLKISATAKFEKSILTYSEVVDLGRGSKSELHRILVPLSPQHVLLKIETNKFAQTIFRCAYQRVP